MRLPLPLVLLLSLLLASPPTRAQQNPQPPPVPPPSPAEQQLLDLANLDRAAHHLAPLLWDASLARAARLHAERVLNEPGELSHRYTGEPGLVDRAAYSGASFAAVSENLARRTRSPEETERLWMSTPVHRANLLDPGLNSAGIGILQSAGLLYAVEDFARAVPHLTPAAIEQSVAASLRSRGVPNILFTEDASGLCQASIDPATSVAALTVTWDGPDPTELPPALLQQLAGKSFRSADVAACPSHKPAKGFNTARVAVLLYPAALSR